MIKKLFEKHASVKVEGFDTLMRKDDFEQAVDEVISIGKLIKIFSVIFIIWIICLVFRW